MKFKTQIFLLLL